MGPLVGRDTEMELLGRLMDLTVRRRRPAVVVLVGEAGVGKSRLAEEISIAAAHEHEAQLLQGRCVPYGEANVWWPIADCIRQAATIDVEMPPAEARLRLRQLVRLTLPDEEQEHTERVVNGLSHILGHEGPLRYIDGHHAFEEVRWAMLRMIEATASRRPMVVRLADLHWADQVVIDLIADMATHLARLPVVLLVTTRRPLLDRWPSETVNHDVLSFNVDPLDAGASAEFVSALLPTSTDSALVGAVLDRSGGNPFFLQELAGLVARDGEDGVELPDNIRALVAARLDRLDRPARRLLENAAVWGRTGPVSLLDQMAHPGEETTAILNDLVAAEVMELNGNRWAFRSDSVREVAYARLPKGERARRHAVIAEQLENRIDRDDPDPRLVDVLARQWADAVELSAELGGVADVPDEAPSKAVEWLKQAGHQAAAVELHRSAEMWFGRALAAADRALAAHPVSDETRLELLLAHGRSLCELRRLDHARAAADEALALAAASGRDHDHARALLLLGDLAARDGQGAAAEEILERAATEFAELTDRRGEAESNRLIGMSALLRGSHDRAEAALDRANDAFVAAGDLAGQAWALQNLAWLYFVTGKVQMAEERIEASASAFADLGDPTGLSWTRGLVGYMRFYAGDFESAAEIAHEVREGARVRSDEWGVAMMDVLSGGVALWTGDVARSVELSSDAQARFELSNDRFGVRHAGALRGLALTLSGRIEEGIRDLEHLVNDKLDASLDFNQVALGSLAHAHVLVGDPERALDVAAADPGDQLDAGLIGIGDRLVAKALALLQLGRLDEADEVLVVLADAGDVARTRPSAMSVRAVGRLLRGDMVGASGLARAVIAEGWRTRWDEVLVRLVLASVAVAVGDDALAVDHLAEARSAVSETDDKIASGVISAFEAQLAVRLETGVAAGRRDTPVGVGAPLAGWWDLIGACLEPAPGLGAEAPSGHGIP